jgi:cob(I)alamin adenosyltransferase
MNSKKAKKSTGDCGYCFLISGKKVKKNHKLVKIYGCIDDVICNLGLVKVNLAHKDKKTTSVLTSIQKELISLNGCLHKDKKAKDKKTSTAFLDKEIAVLRSKMQPLNKFLIPGKNKAEVTAHIARAKTRLAEIAAVDYGGSPQAVKYLNHLSKYLFLLAVMFSKR